MVYNVYGPLVRGVPGIYKAATGEAAKKTADLCRRVDSHFYLLLVLMLHFDDLYIGKKPIETDTEDTS